MNLVRNPLKILSPWWYYVENALVAQALPVLFLILALMGKLQDTWPAWAGGVDLSGIFWPFFEIHVLTGSLNAILMVYHDMSSHPEMFQEVTDYRFKKEG